MAIHYVTALVVGIYYAHALARDASLAKLIPYSRRVALMEEDVFAARQKDGSLLPSGARFVILLRGETFRYDKEGVGRIFCETDAEEMQTRVTRSLLTKVIEPLESQRNSIDIVFTGPPCRLDEQLVGILGHRVKASAHFPSSGQSTSIRQSLEFLNSLYGGPDSVAASFDYVLIQRNDLQWVANVDDWTASWTEFNFLAHCAEKASILNLKWNGGEKCVWDTLHLMPGKMYSAFNDAVGTISDGYKCFREKNDQNGHACYFAITAALKKRNLSTNFGYLTSRHVPVRGDTDFEREFCSLPLLVGP